MLTLFLLPQLVQDERVNTVCFQFDGEPCHYAIDVHTFLNGLFSGRWIGCVGPMIWAVHSRHLTPMDFSVWGFIKGCVFNWRITTLAKFWDRIIQASASHNTKIAPECLLCHSRQMGDLSQCEWCSYWTEHLTNLCHYKHYFNKINT